MKQTCFNTLVTIIVFYIVQFSQLAARVTINYLLTYLLNNVNNGTGQCNHNEVANDICIEPQSQILKKVFNFNKKNSLAYNGRQS